MTDGYKIKRVLVWQNGAEKQIYPAMKWNGDLSKANYVNGFSIGYPYGIQFNPDGTRLFSCGYKGDVSTPGWIAQCDLSTPRDLSTATQNYKGDIGTSTGTYGNYPGIFLANSGQYLYFMDYPTNPNGLYIYSLGTAWDISSAKTQLSFYSGNYIPLRVSENGKKFIWNNDNNSFYSESSTARTINTSGTQIATGGSRGIVFSKDGKYLYTTTVNSKVITKYSLSIPFNPTSTQTQEQQITLSSLNGNISGICFDTNGNNMYLATTAGIYQYSLT